MNVESFEADRILFWSALNDVTILWRKGSINHGQKITENISVRTLYTCIHKDMTTYPVSVQTHHIITINTHKYTVLAGGGCARVSVLRQTKHKPMGCEKNNLTRSKYYYEKKELSSAAKDQSASAAPDIFDKFLVHLLHFINSANKHKASSTLRLDLCHPASPKFSGP